jgi:hypothetical protein
MSETLPVVGGLPKPPTIDKTGPIYRFTESGLQSAIDKAIAGIPPDKQVAVIGFADTKGIGSAAVVRLNNEWSLMGVMDYKWGQTLEFQAAVRWMR